MGTDREEYIKQLESDIEEIEKKMVYVKHKYMSSTSDLIIERAVESYETLEDVLRLKKKLIRKIKG